MLTSGLSIQRLLNCSNAQQRYSNVPSDVHNVQRTYKKKRLFMLAYAYDVKVFQDFVVYKVFKLLKTD